MLIMLPPERLGERSGAERDSGDGKMGVGERRGADAISIVHVVQYKASVFINRTLDWHVEQVATIIYP